MTKWYSFRVGCKVTLIIAMKDDRNLTLKLFVHIVTYLLHNMITQIEVIIYNKVMFYFNVIFSIDMKIETS